MISLKTRRIGLAVLPLWLTSVALLWPHAAYALTQVQYIQQFDWASLGTTCGIAIVGGTGPTLVALLTDQFVLTNVLQRTVKDIGIAAINGAIFFVGVIVVESFKVDVPDGIAFAGVLCAGWARRDFIRLVSTGVQQLAKGLFLRLLVRLGIGSDERGAP
ncbi:hypothetical protein [Xylophilus sp. GOD-11R]|uniref:hypothetical protein n=1 Tax=Xylophilus sp. GOD-11R TaxID=3089814 RepID=UPI00298CDEED|nr:hypothetical protein [Xylophilus sp. GOD-11R]WPB58654.1 hypothetical protein R9X41_08460 [Xylophilus sp. GOD-11R]